MNPATQRNDKPPPPRILVIEDHRRTAEMCALYLRHEGFGVAVAATADEGLRSLTGGGFDLVVLDRMLPGMEGAELCRHVRRTSDVPVLMLTALTTEQDRLDGFDAGADDYVAKPFSPRELVARVKALLRRAPPPERRRLVRGEVELEPESRRVFVRGGEIELTPTEFDMLLALAQAEGRVLTRAQLRARALGPASEASDRVVDAHIKNLRSKIERDRRNPRIIVTVFGSGYRIEPGR